MDTLGKVSTKMQQIAINAERMPQASFTSLAYHLDMEWMYEAYKETRKDGAVGVDGQTAEKFHDELKVNLEKLLEQAKSGMYKAPPVRRTYIPKPGSREERPLGIPTFSDKVFPASLFYQTVPDQLSPFRQTRRPLLVFEDYLIC
jgi:retron-type reverse transcriptase